MGKAALRPTRLYLLTPPDRYRRFMWFHNYAPNEMLVGLHGATGQPATLRYIFPEYEVPTSQLSAVRYDYASAIKVDKAIDHVSCHIDGRFHIKTRDDQDLYIQSMRRTQPLGPDTSTFLEFIVCSHLASSYRPIEGKPKKPFAFVGLHDDQIVCLRSMFSGARYPLEKDALNTIASLASGQPFVQPAILLESGTLKGVFWGRPTKQTPEALVKRPPGTILSFNFPVGQDKWRIKTFILD